MAKAKGRGPRFGLVVDGDRKNLFSTLPKAKEVETVFVAQGCKVVIFEHSDAEIKAKDAADAEDVFFDLGIQYYMAARSSAVLTKLMPVCGNLYHHAVEMFLKAGLCRKYSLDEVYKFQHDLPKLWDEFKADFTSPALLQFDSVIPTLQKWHEIRYPDKLLQEGAQMEVVWVQIEDTSHIAPSSSLPRYEVNGPAMDNFVITILDVLQKLLTRYKYHVNFDPQLREILTRYHTKAAQMWDA
jgi:hypothetical protein